MAGKKADTYVKVLRCEDAPHLVGKIGTVAYKDNTYVCVHINGLFTHIRPRDLQRVNPPA